MLRWRANTISFHPCMYQAAVSTIPSVVSSNLIMRWLPYSLLTRICLFCSAVRLFLPLLCVGLCSHQLRLHKLHLQHPVSGICAIRHLRYSIFHRAVNCKFMLAYQIFRIPLRPLSHCSAPRRCLNVPLGRSIIREGYNIKG